MAASMRLCYAICSTKDRNFIRSATCSSSTTGDCLAKRNNGTPFTLGTNIDHRDAARREARKFGAVDIHHIGAGSQRNKAKCSADKRCFEHGKTFQESGDYIVKCLYTTSALTDKRNR